MPISGLLPDSFVWWDNPALLLDLLKPKDYVVRKSNYLYFSIYQKQIYARNLKDIGYENNLK